METTQNTPNTLHDTRRLERIAQYLSELLDPEYILLFGTYAQATPHSQTAAYDLLVITQQKSRYTHIDAKRYIKLRIPNIGHHSPSANIYIMTQHEIETICTPFTYLVQNEGIVLYQSGNSPFKRPKKRFDFACAARIAENYMRKFIPIADRMLEIAQQKDNPAAIHIAAAASAQATLHYLRTLFFVYHGFDAQTNSINDLYQRVKTLCTELPLLLEFDAENRIHILGRIELFCKELQYETSEQEINEITKRVRRIAEITKNLCEERCRLSAELTPQKV